jgi:hypothetical protein
MRVSVFRVRVTVRTGARVGLGLVFGLGSV